jgi:alpha-tubulin suppressor-like RCC1 family protein
MYVAHILAALSQGLKRPLSILTSGLMVAALGCRPDAGSPTDPTDPAGPELQLAGTAPAFNQISAGNLHSCGVATDGTGYCWGPQAFGELGDGTFGETRNAPAPIAGGLQFSQVRAGTTHSCGLTTEGRAYCWGENSLGQLGDGTAPAGHNTPVPVAGTRRFTQILVGFRHSCALTASGAAFCWGENEHGQLGTGSKTGPQVCQGVACSVRPVRVAGTHVFRQIRPGGEHTCGLDDNHRYFCWGENVFGQLGDGTLTPRLTPVPVVGGRTFSQVSAGGMHTCAVTSTHVAFCWGRNATGQLGDGSTTRRLRPTRVAGTLQFAGVSAGTEHSCGLTTLKKAYCWGSNEFAQLGDGTTTDRHVPTAVKGGIVWQTVLAGWRPSCGISSTGKAYCWGQGGVGDGTGQQRATPTPLAAPM